MVAQSPEVVAAGLDTPEGPAFSDDGALVFVQQRRGAVSRLEDGRVSDLSVAPGAPNSVVVGPDGELYAAQNGGVVGDWVAEHRSLPSIERLEEDGTRTTVVSQAEGHPMAAPNDLVFGPDGLLYVTDPSEGYTPESPSANSRLYRVDVRNRSADILLELDPVYSNGIAFLTNGNLCWVESYTREVCWLEEGRRNVLTTLPEGHIPDGLDVAQDGRLFIASVTSNGVTVVGPEGDLLDHIMLDERAMPTNCKLSGSDLWVTDFGFDHVENTNAGRIWRVSTDAKSRP